MSRPPFNILYLSSFGTFHGGGQRSLFYLVANVDRALFHPLVMLPSEGDLAEELFKEGIDVIILPLPKVIKKDMWSSLVALYKLHRCIRFHNVDLIHTDGPRNTFYGGLVAMINRIPLVWHVRASNKDRYDGILCRLSSKIILVANALRSRFDQIRHNDKFVTVYNGIDPSQYKPIMSVPSVRAQYGIDKKSLIISVIARIEKLKGQRDLIEACGILKNTYKDFCILLVGDSTDEEYRMECEKRARDVGIKDRLIFTGYLEDVRNILAETDIFVLPSLSEAFPRSVIEAMIAGCPVIATDVGGCREAVEEGISGFIVPARSVTALADTLRKLAGDSSLRKNMGNAAKERAERTFSIHRNVEGVKQVYKELLPEVI